MLSAKRTQFRNQIRRQQLRQMFAIRRKELIYGRSGVFEDLFEAIEHDRERGVSMQMIGALLTCHNSHPEEQNTYILISNYLFYHNEALPHLLPRLVNSPCYIQNYMWSLNLIIFILAQNATRCPQEDRYLVIDQVQKVMEVACDFIREVLANLKRRHTGQKQTNGWLYFVQMIVQQLNYQLFQEVPQDTISLFSQVLALQMPEEQSRLQQLIVVWNCIDAIFRHREALHDLKDLLASTKHVFSLVLKNLPHQREACVKVLTNILINNPSDFMVYVYHEELMKQILYLLQQVPKLRPIIVHLLNPMIAEANMEILLNVLTLETHKQLTQTLEWSLAAKDNECIQQCLTAIYTIMSRLQNDQENKLLARVKDQVQALNFDLMIEGMAHCHQIPSLWNCLTRIIDDFYSPEDPSSF